MYSAWLLTRSRRRAGAAGRTPRGAPPRRRRSSWPDRVPVFPGLPPEALSAETVRKPHRAHGQAGLAIKRRKSVPDIDRPQAGPDGALAPVYLRAKVLPALPMDRRARRLAGDVQGNLGGPRKMTRWRV